MSLRNSWKLCMVKLTAYNLSLWAYPRYGHTPLKLPFIPQSMIAQLLQAYHDSPTSGHLGVNKTWHKIRDRYYWPGMYNQIKQYILSCSKC
ncbi:unnamed protein product, partial [Didymodactylos carnosus]